MAPDLAWIFVNFGISGLIGRIEARVYRMAKMRLLRG
jgi:hypothetical protein